MKKNFKFIARNAAKKQIGELKKLVMFLTILF